MKRLTYILLTALAVTALLAGCKKPEKAKETPISVTLEVSGIADNKATIDVAAAGKANGGKIVAAFPLSKLDIDYEQEILLINFVETNGEAIASFPYNATKEKLQADVDYITAVIVYDQKKIAKASAYKIWTAEGLPDGWSQSNDAGKLDPNLW